METIRKINITTTAPEIPHFVYYTRSETCLNQTDFSLIYLMFNVPYSPNRKRNIRDPFKENIDSSRTVAMIQRGP